LSSFIIAEAGANFRISDDADENFAQAIKLIDIAADAGASAVKFQVYRAKKLYVRDAGTADYIGKKKSIYDIIQEMELPYDWLPKLKKHADAHGLKFIASPFDKESADQLESIGAVIYKVASYSLTDYPLLEHLAKKGRPIIMSTGASDMNDIALSVELLRKKGCTDVSLLQCTAKYPAPLSTLNLRVIPQLIKRFGVPVGLSDHSRDPIVAPLGAIALGATIIEKHFTTDNSLPGPDHGFALLPHELKKMVQSIRQMEEALGTGDKSLLQEEKELHDFARHFIFASRKITKGELFMESNIETLRPGKGPRGLAAEYYHEVIGKAALMDIDAGTPIKREHYND